jgi:hypothetical protein
VRHIRADGSIEEHDETERRMVERVGVDPLLDASVKHESLVERAYRELGRAMAYEPPADAP